jgi:uncharacterized protein (DUF488 family)
VQIATIGFTKSSAEHFFERLKSAHIEWLVDIRLRNTSQLAGFARGPDLAYLLGAVAGITYEHDLRLAPTDAILDGSRQHGQTWAQYEAAFLALMLERSIPGVLDRAQYEARKTVLLCSEPTPAQCHRRLVAELLAEAWSAEIEHL